MSIDSIPIWVVFLGTILLVMLAIEVGYRLGDVRHRSSEDEKESPVSAIAGVILGLAAFLLAFTFGIVAERQTTKRTLVREEALALLTAWQRSDFLPPEDRAEAAGLLRQYVDDRVEFVQAGDVAPDRVATVLAETQRVQDRLWSMAVANARRDMNSDVAALYIDSLNAVNEKHAARVAIALQARVPGEIWWVLYGITTLGMMSVGYQTGIATSRRSLMWIILATTFGLVIALIASLDRPDSGLVKVSQQPLIDVRDRMDAAAGGAGNASGRAR